MLETEEIRINLHGYDIAAKQWGDSSKPAIIALHGWLDNAATFDRIAPFLQQYRFIGMDFAGHGYSAHRPEGMRYHYLDNVDDVLGLADTLSLETFLLLGHSMGAGVASMLAGAFPERVEKLILLEGIGSNTSSPEQAPEVLRKAVRDMKRVTEKRKPVYHDRESAVSARMKGIGGISRAASESLCERGLVEVQGGFTWRSDPRLVMSSAMRLTEEMVIAYLDALTMPVLLVSGKQSFFAGDSMFTERTKHISNLTHVELEGNHHLHLEPDTSDAVLHTIQRFLAD